MNQDLILAVGASGTVGTELVKILKGQNFNVRQTTSKDTLLNQTEKVRVNLATGEGVKAAFEDVTHAFLLSPPGYADHYGILSPLIQEAKRRRLKKVVLMTSMVDGETQSTSFRRAERELEKSGLTYNIIRPNWFFQNFNTFWVQGIKEHGKILLPAGNAKTSFIDAKDISTVIAKLLTCNQFDNRVFELTGPKALDHDEIAKELSLVTGKEITYQDIEPSVLKNGLLNAGIPAEYVNFLIVIFGFLNKGYCAKVTGSVKEILGREPRTIQLYAQENKQSWI